MGQCYFGQLLSEIAVEYIIQGYKRDQLECLEEFE